MGAAVRSCQCGRQRCQTRHKSNSITRKSNYRPNQIGTLIKTHKKKEKRGGNERIQSSVWIGAKINAWNGHNNENNDRNDNNFKKMALGGNEVGNELLMKWHSGSIWIHPRPKWRVIPAPPPGEKWARGGGGSYANETFTCPKRAKLINSPPQTIERWPQKINKTHHGIGSLNETSHPLPPSVPPTVPPPLERLNKLDRLSKWPEKAIAPWEAEAGRQGAFRWQIMATLDE